MPKSSEKFPGGLNAVQYLRDSETLGGWYYRNVMLDWAPVEDSGLKSKVIYDIYTKQEEKGFWEYEGTDKITRKQLETHRATMSVFMQEYRVFTIVSFSIAGQGPGFSGIVIAFPIRDNPLQVAATNRACIGIGLSRQCPREIRSI